MSIPSMPLFCGDYLKDTTDLTLEEHGAYLMILMITWATGGKPLPDNDARMAKRLSITKDRWVNKLKPVLAQFFDLSGGTWRNQRLEQEWNYVQGVIAKRREAGAMGGRPTKSGPQDGPGNSHFSDASVQCNLTESCDANSLKSNETSKANGSDLLKQNGSTHPHTSTDVEESKGSLCVSLESTRAPEPAAAAHTQGAPEFSENKTSNIVPFVAPGRPEVLPVGWVLPAAYRAYAEAAGQTNIDGAARRFAVHWCGRGAKTEAEWRQAWENWIDENIERGYGNGAGRNTNQRRANGGLAAVIIADLAAGAGNPQGGPDGW